MMGHVVRLRPGDHCLSISPTVTVPYNADFDGDEMNLHITSVQSRADARCLMGVEHNILSASSGAPCVRLVQDACLARYLTSGQAAAQQMSQIVALCEQHSQAGAAQRLHTMQLDAYDYMSNRGFSVGVDDFITAVPYEGADRRTLGAVAACIANTVPATNRIHQMVTAGSKGSLMNLVQLFACVGYQTVGGRGAQRPCGTGDSFVRSSFTAGLTPDEFWMHACASREGMIQTAVKTADAGYLMRRMVKCFENVVVAYDETVRTSGGRVVQFSYGGDGIDPTTARFRRPRRVEPGEPVGILCAQSIGQKLTQLTLDTFHKAGVAFKHGLLRVKAILDASDKGPLLRGAPRPYTLVQYCLDDLVWQPCAWQPAVSLEMRMRGIKILPRFRAEPKLAGTGLAVWHIAARLRASVQVVSDERYVYVHCVPGAVACPPRWAGARMLDTSIELVSVPDIWDPHVYVSEPPLVARQLGIEAACASIRSELAPFMAGVNERHIMLLADAMTHTGAVLGATRAGIRCSDGASVLGRACFETAPQVLSVAARHEVTDPLHAASSRLAIGCIPRLGASAMDTVERRATAPQLPAESLLLMPPAKRTRFGAYM